MKPIKQLTALLLALLLPVATLPAGITQQMLAVVAKKKAAGAGSFVSLFSVAKEGFETATTGYQAAEFSTSSGTVNPVATDQVLSDTQSLKLDGSGGVSFSRWVVASSTEVYAKWNYRVSALPSGNSFYIMAFRTGAGTLQGYLAITSSGTIRCYNGSTFDTTTDAISANTNYYFWYHWKSDGTAEFSFSATDSRPTSGNAYKAVSGGSGTSAITRVQPTAGDTSALVAWLDDLKVGTGGWPP